MEMHRISSNNGRLPNIIELSIRNSSNGSLEFISHEHDMSSIGVVRRQSVSLIFNISS